MGSISPRVAAAAGVNRVRPADTEARIVALVKRAVS
jgi:hypothetical protein